MNAPKNVSLTVSRNDVEEMLRGFMAKVLPSAPTDADMQIPFLEMGANSLALMEVQRAVETEYGLTISIPQFFQELTNINALVDYIVEKQPSVSVKIEVEDKQAQSIAEPTIKTPTPLKNNNQLNTLATDVDDLQTILSRQLETASKAINQVVAKQLQFLQELEATEDSTPLTKTPEATLKTKPQNGQPKSKNNDESASTQKAIKSSSTTVMHRMLSPLETRARGLTAKQSEHLETLIQTYTEKTKVSKALASKHRASLADSRAAVGFRFTTKEMLYPIVGRQGKGSRVWDVDGNEYIDITMGQGVTLFGHHPKFIDEALADPENDTMMLGPRSPHVGEAAQLACEMTGMDRVTFTNSGTEAVMVALRLARAATGRNKIVMFENAYHGHADNVMGRPVKNEDQLSSVPVAPGITQGSVDDIWLLDYGSDSALEYIKAHGHEIAAVMVEPVQSRRPDLQPRTFLHELRHITEQSGSLLMFDEMITGFRVHQGGAQAWFGVKADIATYGKVLAGGMPIGMVAGDAKYMDAIDGGAWQYGDNSYPEADRTIFGGTFCQHPTAMITTLATLRYLKQEGPQLQERLNEKTKMLAAELNEYFDAQQIPMRVIHFGSLFRFSFEGNFELLFYHMMQKGIFIWEWRNYFLSTAHTDEDINDIISAVKESVTALQEGGFITQRKNESELPEPTELNEAQKQLLTLAEIIPEGSKAYHISPLLALKGKLQVKTLKLAVREVMRRHDALRTVIVNQQQQILPLNSFKNVDLTYTDLSQELSPEKALTESLSAHAERAFDLSSDPLFEVHLYCMAENEHRLLIKAHHIVTDGLSVNLIVHDLTALYNANLQGVANTLATPMQFSEYLNWQKNASFDKQKAYWLTQLSGELPVLDLPVDRPEPLHKTYRGGRYCQEISAPLLAKIQLLSRNQSCTDFMTLFSIYALWLHRLCQQDDLLIGIPVAGRNLKGADELVGYATHLIPVRSRATWNQPFNEYLRSMRDTLLASYENQDLPFSELLNEENFKSRRSNLISAIFNLDRPGAAPNMDDVEVKWLSQPVHYTAFPITLNLTEVDNGMVLECDFSRDLFDTSSIERYVDSFFTILENVIEKPEQTLDCVPLLNAHNQKRLFTDWNNTTKEYNAENTIIERFETQTTLTPTAIALYQGETAITYEALNSQANQLAVWLQNQGVQAETVVGVCLERSANLIVSLLAILKAGGAYLPLDPAYPTQRLQFMVEDADVTTLLTQSSISKHFDGLNHIHSLCLDTQQKNYINNPQNNLEHQIKPTDLAYLIYTSGSTGKPKGTLIEHRNLSNYIYWASEYYQVSQGDGAPLHSSISFDATITSLFLPLLNGRALTLLPEDEKQEIEHICSALQSDKEWSFIKLTPAHLELVNVMVPNEKLGQQTQCVVLGGDALLNSQIKPWQAFATDTRIINEYGPTETVVGCCVYQADPNLPTNNTVNSVPIGKPIANTQLYVLDQNKQPVPIGVKGELYIAGNGVARGYYKQENLTAARFIQISETGISALEPEENNTRLYRTGDIVKYMPDGNLVYLGRSDNQIKLRGYRIELGEIENAITQENQIREAVVTINKKTEKDIRLNAYVVINSGFVFDEQQLRSSLINLLPAHMLPSTFTELESLPLTANGKVDRTALPEPNAIRSKIASALVNPSNEAEKKIASMWRELLGIEQLSVNDNFFELGGHSLLVIPLRDQLQTMFEKPLLPVDIFRLPTIAAQARFMTKTLETQQPTKSENIKQRASRQRQAFKKKKQRNQSA
ncbi:non-ribosomal peptide synthetase [Algibacillus agarilyticus]|uniref:non-ribosomal peptide synthetase n=1 Tax=Algibacillus agarilyticus TaxID=2234133 RepID=UPI000DCFAA83|nr:non-ribosomal peptide synthetase [Algibacillus agarilyticus]